MSLVFVEKGIDREGKIWYTNEAVASGGTERGGEADLENDTEKRESSAERERDAKVSWSQEAEREKRSQNSERESCESAKRKSLARWKRERRSSGRIEHKSLILAQDERWRRA